MSWAKGDHLIPTGTPTSQQMSFNSGHSQVLFIFNQNTIYFFLKKIKIKFKIHFFVAPFKFMGSIIQ